MPATTILLVDDQLSSLIAIEQILEELDAHIVKAMSAKEALRIMLTENVDCILLDVSMPEMDGFDFLSTLRTAPAHRNIPVIMVTGKIFSENESLRAYQHGAVDYLLKPLDSEIVFRKVSFIVQQAERIRAIDAMAAIMKNFETDVLTPLKNNLLNKSTATSITSVMASKDAQSKNSGTAVALDVVGNNDIATVSDNDIEHAMNSLNQLYALWEAFDDSKPFF